MVFIKLYISFLLSNLLSVSVKIKSNIQLFPPHSQTNLQLSGNAVSLISQNNRWNRSASLNFIPHTLCIKQKLFNLFGFLFFAPYHLTLSISISIITACTSIIVFFYQKLQCTVYKTGSFSQHTHTQQQKKIT